ncbi:MAG: hypothetical protein ABIO76_06690, partial [Ginsengibacter sp.]
LLSVSFFFCILKVTFFYEIFPVNSGTEVSHIIEKFFFYPYFNFNVNSQFSITYTSSFILPLPAN